MNLHTVVFYIPLRSSLPQCSVFSLCFSFKGFLTSGRIYYVPSRWKWRKKPKPKQPVYYNTSKRITNLSHVRHKTKSMVVIRQRNLGRWTKFLNWEILLYVNGFLIILHKDIKQYRINRKQKTSVGSFFPHWFVLFLRK